MQYVFLWTQVYLSKQMTAILSFNSGTDRYRTLSSIRYSQEGLGNHKKALETHVRTCQNICRTRKQKKDRKSAHWDIQIEAKTTYISTYLHKKNREALKHQTSSASIKFNNNNLTPNAYINVDTWYSTPRQRNLINSFTRITTEGLRRIVYKR